MSTKGFLKACGGGFVIGLVSGSLFGPTAVGYGVALTASTAWGMYCGYQELDPVSRYALNSWTKEKMSEFKQKLATRTQATVH